MLPYGDVWRASRRMFTKYFNPSESNSTGSISQPREITYVRRFLGQLLLKPNDFLQHVQTYVPVYYISGHSSPFFRISLVFSTAISMTYSINIQPYNDPHVKSVEEALSSTAELLIPGVFLVDIIPILKYVPEWFPGADFQRKAAIMRKHAAKIRNTLFAATKEIMACDSSPFLGFLLDDTYFFSDQQ